MPLTGRGGVGNRANRTPSPEYRRDSRDKAKTPQVRVRKASTHNNQSSENERNQLNNHGNPGIGGSAGENGEEDEIEIAQDPFFKRYDVSGNGSEQQSSPALSRNSSSDTEGPLSPGHIRSPRLPSSPRNSTIGGHEGSKMQEINICILGASGVGKTSFIVSALELRNPPASAFSTRKIAMDDNTFSVNLVELCLDDMPDLPEDGAITWPDTIDDLATPRIDGACILYDVMSQESLEPIPEMLNALTKASLPFALVGWKCDIDPALHNAKPEIVEKKAYNFLGKISTFRGSRSAQDVQKRCLSVVLHKIASSREEQPMFLSARRRANSSAIRHGVHGQPWAKKHERASSEYSGIRMRMHTPEPNETGPSKLSTSQKSRHCRNQTGDTTYQTFLDLDDSPGYDTGDSDVGLSDDGKSVVSEMPSDEKGYTFDQLVNRLLAQPMSKNDTKFQSVFLALYRKFATPGQLLDAIIERFQTVDQDKKPQMLKNIAQLRYLAVVEQWVRSYPGDFAYFTTKRKFRKFVSRLVNNRIFAIAAQEIAADLECVTEDDDTDWSCCDRARDRQEAGKSFAVPNSVLDEDSGDEDYSRLMSSMSMGDRHSLRASTIPVPMSANSSSQTLLNGVENAQKQARGLMPLPRINLTKIQWHTLMGIEEEYIARELTRIDWIMFSAIRPRDLVRHVSLNAEQKKQCRSLENVNRMIEHFNHVANWVANYVLLREKPKHRALMLEKFMKLARKVREMNNYNSLGAILAGINGTAIHRLALTREMIPAVVGKDFMKLQVLMGTQRSHFAYRLAWDNSSGERIPYLPLHRRDLVSAAEGNSTFVTDRKSDATLSIVHPGTAVFTNRTDTREAPVTGIIGKERINWKKFEIMGEVIVGMQRAQGAPYPPISRNDEVRSLLLEVKMSKDEDELYERSVSLEAGASGNQRRFNWFKG